MENRISTKEKNNCNIDKIITSKKWGYPLMLTVLGLVFWITIIGANYPSQWLSNLFNFLYPHLCDLCRQVHMPDFLQGMIIDGFFKTIGWVVSVMLPPMAIFFPLFAILEELGYLPRVAFNMNSAFKKCNASGRQAITMCMGLGCNACGIIGCRAIESKQQRLMAVLTNSFMPCNGRFPALIALISMFFVPFSGPLSGLTAALLLLFFISFAILMTLVTSKILSLTFLKDAPQCSLCELPPYKKPNFLDIIIHSFFEKTLFVLARAVIVAGPAGILIWLLANTQLGPSSLLSHITDFFNSAGVALGVDGAIITAFILGFPANEIVFPIILMTYLSQGALVDCDALVSMKDLLISHGWSSHTALATIVLCFFHFPCGSCCLTIKKETGSFKWVALSVLLPASIGILTCLIINIFVTRFCP